MVSDETLLKDAQNDNLVTKLRESFTTLVISAAIEPLKVRGPMTQYAVRMRLSWRFSPSTPSRGRSPKTIHTNPVLGQHRCSAATDGAIVEACHLTIDSCFTRRDYSQRHLLYLETMVAGTRLLEAEEKLDNLKI